MNLTIDIHHHFHIPVCGETTAKLDQIADSIAQLKENIIMNDAQLQTTLDGVTATLTKVGGEIDAFKTSAAADVAALQSAITALEAELANLGQTSPATDAKLAALQALALALDGKIDDLPAVPA